MMCILCPECSQATSQYTFQGMRTEVWNTVPSVGLAFIVRRLDSCPTETNWCHLLSFDPECPLWLRHQPRCHFITPSKLCWVPSVMEFLLCKQNDKRQVLLVSRVRLCDPMDYSRPGSSVHGMLQARILEWLAIPFSRGSSWPRDWAPGACIAGRFYTVWATEKLERRGARKRRRVAMATQVEFELDLEGLGGFCQMEKSKRKIPVTEVGRGIRIWTKAGHVMKRH